MKPALQFLLYVIIAGLVVNLLSNLIWKYIPEKNRKLEKIVTATLISICIVLLIFYKENPSSPQNNDLHIVLDEIKKLNDKFIENYRPMYSSREEAFIASTIDAITNLAEYVFSSINEEIHTEAKKDEIGKDSVRIYQSYKIGEKIKIEVESIATNFLLDEHIVYVDFLYSRDKRTVHESIKIQSFKFLSETNKFPLADFLIELSLSGIIVSDIKIENVGNNENRMEVEALHKENKYKGLGYSFFTQ